MSRLGSLLGKVSRGIGRGAVRASGSRAAMGTIAAGTFGLGFLNTTAPAARDAAFAAAFGDPNADVAFTGRKLDTRFLVGKATGGLPGGLLRYSSPNAFTFNPVFGDSNVGLGVAGGVTAGFGAIAGGYGAGFAKAAKNTFLESEAFTNFAAKYPKTGALTRGAGALATNRVGGAFIGALGFGGLAVKGLIGNQFEQNKKFIDESPYMPRSGSLATAQALNASGNIVLGMHNSRRGY